MKDKANVRKNLINAIEGFLVEHNKKNGLPVNTPYNTEEQDLWVNDSEDGAGEEQQVNEIAYQDGKIGVSVGGDGDFYGLDELETEELLMLYEEICEEE